MRKQFHGGGLMMMQRWKHVVAIASLAAAISLSSLTACKKQDAGEGCQSDEGCGIGFLCNRDSGLCQCSTDDVCGAGDYCNSFGVCQTRPPCLGNKDCATAQLCDSSDATGGVCIEKIGCGSSVHCEFNQYCDAGIGRCVAGCRNTGDCELGSVCSDGTCVAGGTATDCTTCPTRPSFDAAYCDYGELCTGQGQCSAHAQRAKLCSRCGIDTGTFPPQNIQCATGLMCLVDTETSDAFYCAPTCKTDADCPSGFGTCGGLALQGEDCTSSGRCANGGVCLGGSESNRRSCSCVAQADCTTGLVCRSGACVDALFGQQAGLPCTTNYDCEATCEFIATDDGLNIGQCVLNQRACGKEAGVTCEELTTGVSACRATHNG